jgi:uncharacterized membrane protein YjjP (DUF1212 family)
MKYYKLIGITACALLLVSCFLPWAYYADLHRSFTGFYTEKNEYGKPGVFFSFIAICSVILILIDKIWAKRVHIIFAAITIGYLIKTYILFTSCYIGYCPEKKFGIFILITACTLMMIVALFPDIKLMDEKGQNS